MTAPTAGLIFVQAGPPAMDPAVLRADMVDGVEHAMDLAAPVAEAMRSVPREEFVDDRPYDNRTGERAGTTVLAPATAATLLDALAVEPGDEVLVVGAGVGYTAAVLAELTDPERVHAVDITSALVWEARGNLARAGYDAVLVDRRDGADGLPEYAPFDRILVEAAAVRPPQALLSQLAPDGRLVMPLGAPPEQRLVAVAAVDGGPDFEVVEEFEDVRFRPLLVEGEQADGIARNRTEREDREFAQSGYFAPTGWEQDWIDWDSQF